MIQNRMLLSISLKITKNALQPVEIDKKLKNFETPTLYQIYVNKNQLTP